MKYLLVSLIVITAFCVLFNRQSKKVLISNTTSNLAKTSVDEKTACSDVIAKYATESGIPKYSGDIKQINFNSLPEAKLFKTTITNSYKEGANFAGHYNLSLWGCGTDCFGMSITDVETGNIIEYSPIHEGYHLDGYNVDNRLIVFNPINAGMERKIYKLSESSNKTNALELICSEISQNDMYQYPE